MEKYRSVLLIFIFIQSAFLIVVFTRLLGYHDLFIVGPKTEMLVVAITFAMNLFCARRYGKPSLNKGDSQ